MAFFLFLHGSGTVVSKMENAQVMRTLGLLCGTEVV
jgi:hypothetical protein